MSKDKINELGSGNPPDQGFVIGSSIVNVSAPKNKNAEEELAAKETNEVGKEDDRKPDSQNEEIDLFSCDHSKNPPYVLVECTLALMSTKKLKQCVRKRKAIENQYNLSTESVMAYLMCMRISPDNEEELREQAIKEKVMILLAYD